MWFDRVMHHFTCKFQCLVIDYIIIIYYIIIHICTFLLRLRTICYSKKIFNQLCSNYQVLKRWYLICVLYAYMCIYLTFNPNDIIHMLEYCLWLYEKKMKQVDQPSKTKEKCLPRKTAAVFHPALFCRDSC